MIGAQQIPEFKEFFKFEEKIEIVSDTTHKGAETRLDGQSNVSRHESPDQSSVWSFEKILDIRFLVAATVMIVAVFSNFVFQ
jgi:hypothetical protein